MTTPCHQRNLQPYQPRADGPHPPAAARLPVGRVAGAARARQRHPSAHRAAAPANPEPTAILKLPNGAHWLGTDELGRDILARLIYGARDALVLSLEVVAVSIAVGAPLGLWRASGRDGATGSQRASPTSCSPFR